MIKRKIQIDIDRFPVEVRDVFSGAEVYDSSSSSNARVYYCDTGYFVKVDAKGELAEEAAMGRIFHRKGLGVPVVGYVSRDRDYLVTRSAVGQDLTHYLQEPKKLCDVLAEALRRLHGERVTDVPVSSRFRRYMDQASGDCSGGYYDPSVLMDRFRIGSKEEAWAIMQRDKDALRADTLIHGDACLPNVIVDDGKFETFIDLSMAGVGDRHIDLYWALWSLQYNLKTEKYTERFLDGYGREGVDLDMLRVVAAFEVFG